MAFIVSSSPGTGNAHARQQIRDSIVTALASMGMSVFSSRAYSTSVIPSVNVTIPSEAIAIDTMSSGNQTRDLTVQVDLMVDASTDVDDAADSQCVVLEKAILTNVNVLNLVKYIELESMESELSGEGDKPILVLSHTFIAQYRVNEADPEVIIA